MRTSEQIYKDIQWWEKEINDNPNHPTNIYAEKERSKLLKELQEVQMKEWNI